MVINFHLSFFHDSRHFNIRKPDPNLLAPVFELNAWPELAYLLNGDWAYLGASGINDAADLDGIFGFQSGICLLGWLRALSANS